MKLKFYDLKKKVSFETDKFDLKEMTTSKGKKYFAVAVSPSGTQSYRIISKAMYEELEEN
jgi:hypothetical protein